MDSSHFQIIGASFAGQRPADDHTQASLAILTERLEDVRSHGGLFAGIEFSDHALKLRQRCEPLSVG